MISKKKKNGDCRNYYLRIQDLEFLALPHSPQMLQFKIFKETHLPKDVIKEGLKVMSLREMKKCFQ